MKNLLAIGFVFLSLAPTGTAQCHAMFRIVGARPTIANVRSAGSQSIVLFGKQIDFRYLDGAVEGLKSTHERGVLVLDELWGSQAPGTRPPGLAASAWAYAVIERGLDPSRVVLRRARIRGMRQSALRVTIQWRGQPLPLLEDS